MAFSSAPTGIAVLRERPQGLKGRQVHIGIGRAGIDPHLSGHP